MEAGALKILCEHAHSANAHLRLNAIWALKHLVFSAENDVKVSCLEELGSGWLVQLISDGIEPSGKHNFGRFDGNGSASNGEAENERMKIDAQEGGVSATKSDDIDALDANMEDSVTTVGTEPNFREEIRPGTDASLQYFGPDADARLSALIEAESDPASRARKEEVAVQEQGLEFIRNLICGPGSSEMIDFLFQGLGQDRVFDILASKIRPRIATIPSRSRVEGAALDTLTIQPAGEIVSAVCYVLVHIAAGHPRHRQVLISQTELLKLLVPLFDHPNKNVRAALAWVVINLTWVDDGADQGACKQRALELRRLGFFTKLEGLENDAELDVKERTKTALFQMRTMLAS